MAADEGRRARRARVAAVLLDPHPAHNAGLRTALQGAGIDVLGAYEAADALLQDLTTGSVAPDVAVAEVLDGVHARFAALERVVGLLEGRVLVLSGSDDERHAYEAVRVVGARGFLDKRADARTIAGAVAAVAAGATFLGDGLAERLDVEEGRRRRWGLLSDREQQVLALLAQGRTQRGIAVHLELSTNTVKDYISAIYRKLGAQSAVDATRAAIERGLVTPDGRIVDDRAWGGTPAPDPREGLVARPRSSVLGAADDSTRRGGWTQ